MPDPDAVPYVGATRATQRLVIWGGGEWTGSSLCYWNMAGTDPDAVNVK